MERPERRARPPVKVLYVGGAGRSGSTLLDLVLGELPGFFPVGELKYVWQRGVLGNELCGCGEPFLSCPFWTEVGEKAFGGWETFDVERVLELERAVDRHAYIPLMRARSPWPAYGGRFSAFVEMLEELYAAIAEVSGASVVVDSTKRPSTAFLLRHLQGVDLRFVQLVRDSRGVAFSWSKRVKRPEVVEGVEFMPRYDALKASVRWMGNNSLFHVLARLGVPGIRVRYESLIREPRTEVERVVDHLAENVPPGALDFLERSEVELKTNHIVAGNPVRLGGRTLNLRLDDAWKEQMDRRQKSLVVLLTWPLLLQYGYLGSSSDESNGTPRSAAPETHDGERRL